MLTAIKAGLLFTIASAAALGVSLGFMAQRTADYNEKNPPASWHFEQDIRRSFILPESFGKRNITIADTKLPDGQTALKLTFGERELVITSRPPLVPDQPDLKVYEEWLAVLTFSKIEKGKFTFDARTGEGVRCIIVNRRAADGLSPDTWGSVMAKDWTFDFIELKPDGTIDRRLMQFQARKYGTNTLYLPALKADPTSTVQPILERTWEWQAALHAVPKAQVSRYRFQTDAIGGNATTPGMGWTLPVAGFAVLGLLAGVTLLMSSRVHRR